MQSRALLTSLQEIDEHLQQSDDCLQRFQGLGEGQEEKDLDFSDF